MPVYNHYYTRGYRVITSPDGNHQSSDQNQDDNYCTVGCSRGLQTERIDFMGSNTISFDSFKISEKSNVSSSSGRMHRSLYFIPRFCQNVRDSFGVSGQTTKHPTGNAIEQRAHTFTHNLILDSNEVVSLLKARRIDLLLNFAYKENYVNDKRSKNRFSLYCMESVDDRYESAKYLETNQIGSSVSSSVNIDFRFYGAIVLGLTRSAHTIVGVGDSYDNIDSVARSILRRVFSWMPQKYIQDLGFLTCLNQSTAHPKCKLIFCSKEELEFIRRNGIGDIKASDCTFVDLTSYANNKFLDSANLKKEENDYLTWLTGCISGNYDSEDERICKKLDEYENQINSHSMPLGIIVRLYKWISAATTGSNEVNIRQRGICGLSMMSIALKSGIPELPERILKVIGKDLCDIILSREVGDKLIEEIYRARSSELAGIPEVLAKVPENGEVASLKLRRCVYLSKSLTELLAECSNPAVTADDFSYIMMGAIHRYQRNEYNEEEIPHGFNICRIALNRFTDNNATINNGCQRLAPMSYNLIEQRRLLVFNDIKNIDDLLVSLKLVK